MRAAWSVDRVDARRQLRARLFRKLVVKLVGQLVVKLVVKYVSTLAGNCEHATFSSATISSATPDRAGTRTRFNP